VLACSVLEKQKMVKCSNMDVYTHYHHTQKGRFYIPQLGQRDGSIVRQDK